MDSSLGKIVLEKDSTKEEGYTAIYLDTTDVSEPFYAIEQYRPFSKLPDSLGISIGCQVNHEKIIQYYEPATIENIIDDFIALSFIDYRD